MSTNSSVSTSGANTRTSRLQQRSLSRHPVTNDAENNLNATLSSPASTSTMPARQRRKQRKLSSSSNNKRQRRLWNLPWGIVLGMTGMLAIWLAIPLYLFRYGSWKGTTDSFKKRFIFPLRNTYGETSIVAAAKPISKQDTQQQIVVSSSTTTLNNDSNNIKPAAAAAAPKIRAAAHLVPLRKLESEQIDMRDMSATLPFEDKDGGVWKQGWDIIPKDTYTAENPLQVFVVPHSHCDPGWIKTFDDYFKSQTSSIITSVVNTLSKDERRKFIWAEISYFEWWWREQSKEQQEKARRLLQNGQLQFVTGGWVQPDEANTELYAMELQLQEGHEWIRTTFGSDDFLPKYGWSIDPFGYSPTMAYLLQKYGFEGMLIQRVHYAVKKELASKRQLEFIWRQTWDDAGEHDIFTHLMPFYSYDVPHTCGPDPSVCCQFDFARGSHYPSCPWRKDPKPTTPQNVHERAMLILDQWKKKAALYRGNAVLIPLGDDFRYRSEDEANSQFTNFQAIFDYINQNVPGVQAQFGTLGDYFKHVIGSFDTPILKGAFFTYSDREQDYWSGYFTSRVFDKALDRKLERVLYAADSVGLTPLELQEPRRALSLFQHHDGVTGTAKSHVVDDYAKKMHQAIQAVQTLLMQKLVPDHATTNIDACWKSDSPRGLSQNLCGEASDVYVYNPLASPQKCGAVTVPPQETKQVSYPCEAVVEDSSGSFKFDKDGLMVEPVHEQWMKWQVTNGGAYLFFPGHLVDYSVIKQGKNDQGGWLVSTPHWKRTIIRHEYDTDQFGSSAIVLDFIYETNLQSSNEEWLVRFTSEIQNGGVFHTDLNGFNFDTHHYREDMPIQSQVFPMPTLASIQDQGMRMTILSEHAQGTASLETGTIDVWLDRRLAQDDNRGLGQGVTDNVPTRTRLRVLMEKEGFDPSKTEFEITPLCRRMWDELNHPLEAFGKHTYKTAKEAQHDMGDHGMIGAGSSPGHVGNGGEESDHHAVSNTLADVADVVSPSRPRMVFDDSTPIVPIVIMVFKRVDYLKQLVQSIRDSDIDGLLVPIVVSQDGNVKEVTEYIESLKGEFPRLQRMVHPYSCYEHPDNFPGDSGGKLNEGYKGDSYRNLRDGKVTCCKHHFTWMLKTVHSDLKFDIPVDHFLFMEEDYIVAPTVYDSVIRGIEFLKTANAGQEDEGLFGIVLDPTNGNAVASRSYKEDGFYMMPFVSNPMVLSRDMIGRILHNGKEYCTFDDYNWDWSIVHLQAMNLLPRIVLVTSKIQVKHIGVDGGMHTMDEKKKARMNRASFDPNFHATKLHPVNWSYPQRNQRKGYGGWGHEADQTHCQKILNVL